MDEAKEKKKRQAKVAKGGEDRKWKHRKARNGRRRKAGAGTEAKREVERNRKEQTQKNGETGDEELEARRWNGESGNPKKAATTVESVVEGKSTQQTEDRADGATAVEKGDEEQHAQHRQGAERRRFVRARGRKQQFAAEKVARGNDRRPGSHKHRRYLNAEGNACQRAETRENSNSRRKRAWWSRQAATERRCHNETKRLAVRGQAEKGTESAQGKLRYWLSARKDNGAISESVGPGRTGARAKTAQEKEGHRRKATRATKRQKHKPIDSQRRAHQRTGGGLENVGNSDEAEGDTVGTGRLQEDRPGNDTCTENRGARGRSDSWGCFLGRAEAEGDRNA
ncbi:hypothetical protein ERJ75_000486900 [Trypanosoma vivax]|nr:hypothetical protein ERJ75_000486900 [Trypanosoma vivax]